VDTREGVASEFPIDNRALEMVGTEKPESRREDRDKGGNREPGSLCLLQDLA